MNKTIRRMLSVLLAAAVMLSFASPAFADGAVHIKSADDLISLAQSCTLDTWSQGATVELDADISLDGVDFTPIPSFGGDFNGNGHTISGLNISGKYSRAGLFAEIQEGGSVSNLNVTGTVDISGSSEAAGGIAGVNAGRISSCTFTGSVSGSVNVGAIAGQNALVGTIRNCTATGAVYGNRMTGGIVGRNLGLISSCGNSAYVNTVNDDKTLSIQDISIDTSFDLAKLSNRDTVTSTTDTGGIAGYSSGIIRSCHNEAIVGYRHVGYNVGGIAGRSCGFVSGCRNSGTVYGRKDVGGIVGQMEPYMELNVENSTLAKLQQQLAELSALIDQTANDAQGSSGAVSSRLGEMGSYVDGALGEIDNIEVSIGGEGQIEGEGSSEGSVDVSVDVPPLDVNIDSGHAGSGTISGGFEIVATPDLGGLAAAISGIGSQLSMLNGEIAGAAGAVANDVRAINEKFNELSNTMFDAIFAVGTEDGDILKDTSSVDIDLVKLGKVSANTNTGAVSGDLNIGGIAGAMAIEYEADPEDDVTSNISSEYKREYELKAVLQNCTNKGTVTARRSYVGGIAGRMDLGLITGCRGFGDVSSESGDYVGGVAGLASAAVRSCWAKCKLSGSKYVGGIVGSGVEEALTGSGSTVTGCVSMVEITDAAQYYGAVSGSAAGEYLENYFVSDTLPGIDGRSVSGKAEPISYEELIGIDALPAEFTTMQLSFVADGETLKTVDFDYGDSFSADVYPEIPAKDGYYAKWDRSELNDLCFDTVVTAEYELEYSALPSDDTRGDERPVFFVEGKFNDTDALSSSANESGESGLTPLDSELSAVVESDSTSKLPLLARLTAPISGGIVEQRHVTIPDDGQSLHTLHYLPPEVTIGSLNIYVMQDGRWVKADVEEFGSYLRFDVTGTEADIAAVSVISVWWIWGILAVIVIAVVLLIVLSVKRRRMGRADKAEKEKKAPARTETAPKPEKKRRKKPVIIVIIVLLVCALIAAAAFFVPELTGKLAPYRALAELERAQELSLSVTADGTLGGAELRTIVPVEVKSDGDNRITRVTLENVPLYYSNGMLILENGKAYSISGAFPDYSSLLGDIAALYKNAEYTSNGDTCTVSIGGTQAAELLSALCPALSGDTETVEDAYAETVIENGAVRSITVTASGSIDGAVFEVSAVIDGITRSASFDIPEKVSLAAAKNNASELPEISGDLFRIVSAWAELDERESIVSSLRLSADCGPVVLDTALDVSSCEYGGKRIYCVGKNDLKLYTDGSSAVNANGSGVTDEENQLATSANLLDAVYLACLNGNISAARDGEKYTYTVALDGDGIAQLVEIIAPAASKLDADFAYGTVSLTIDGGRITGLSVRCTGTMQVVLVDTEVSVSADVVIQNGSAPQFPEKAVSALTQAIG